MKYKLDIIRKSKIFKFLACYMALNLLAQAVIPTVAYALTGGPSQPEFSTFEPVATTELVNEFSGDFTYNLPVLNIPGANGGGYPMSLSYHSGASPEDEASWVGYGWTLNPGAITRNKRGFPDDWKDADVTYHNKSKPNRTVTVGGGVGFEIFSIDPSANASIRYNNYRGFGYNAGIGLSLGKGVISLGFNVSDGEGSFSAALNPAASLNYLKEKRYDMSDFGTANDYTKWEKREATKSTLKQLGKRGIGTFNLFGSNYGIFSHAGVDRPVNISSYSGTSWNFSAGVIPTPSPLQLGFPGNIFGSYSVQENVAVEALKANGYMYSAASGDNDMMDYTIEKSSTYNKNDRFLGMPFSSQDNFIVSGEGIGGGFRMFHKNAGHYKPNAKESNTNIYNTGGEFESGLNWGGGADAGVGFHKLSVSKWNNITSFSDAGSNAVDEPVSFRFTNDPGGHALYGNEALQQAGMSYSSTIPGAKSVSVSAAGIGATLNNGARPDRSSYIRYSTNGEIETKKNGVRYRAYTKDPAVNGLVNRAETTSMNYQIGEYNVVNEEGISYTYGLPLYSRNEKNISVDLAGVSGSNIDNNYIAYRNVNDPLIHTKIGEEQNLPYAAMYLLTSITTPDYIDRTNNGPTEDDFGGWTRFVYNRVHGSYNKVSGSSGDWYKWRIPYNGLLYNRNELSDPTDDAGSYSEGEKEIYYLDTIETKTHLATFEKSDRLDGLDADHSSTNASSQRNAKGTKKLKKLDRIKLYTKQADGSLKLEQITHFQYDYSLCKGLPNSNGSSGNNGKLTLKKVWSEFQGIVNEKIEPFRFEYAYPPTPYPAKYNGLQNYGSGMTENPDYNPFMLDPWGNYQAYAQQRFTDMQSWMNQDPQPDFDPAAWQLKVIKLPSGGEIHVQYEQDDYTFVQEKPAHAMVSLTTNSMDVANMYYLNTADLGINTSEYASNMSSHPVLKELLNGINNYYRNYGRRIYFKFLYNLTDTDTPQITDCNAEYITGYAKVLNTGIDNHKGLWVMLGSTGSSYSTPKPVCEDYVRTQRAGNLRTDNVCDASESGVISGTDAVSIIYNAANWIESLALPDYLCAGVNYTKSYLRIPVAGHKKGGGVRVKRLFKYDKGIESGYPELYGSEYIYGEFDSNGIYRSYGVAANEPASAREENVLVQFMERHSQSLGEKIVSGRDKKQTEGPLGETVMPGASVGYSKVIIKNIHSGKTNPGFTVKNFFTAKDFPFTIQQTPIDEKTDYLPLPTGFVNVFINKAWMTQGFVFKNNNMHGQMRSNATYAGDYANIYNPQKTALIASEEYTYFKPDEQLPVMYGPDDIGSLPLGREMDIAFESRKVSDESKDANVEFDIDAGVFGLIVLPFGSLTPSLGYSLSELYQHVTTKVINYPAVVKSVRSYRDGVYHLSENVAFSPETGKPLMVHTRDGFDKLDLVNSLNHKGEYTQYTIPASQKYDAMGQKAKNERKFVHSGSGLTINRKIDQGRHYLFFSSSQGDVCGSMGNFTPGDLVMLSNDEIYNIGYANGNELEIFPLSYGTYSTTASVSISSIEVVKSGRTNQLSAQAEGFTTYGNSQLNTKLLSDATNLSNSEYTKRKSLADLLTNLLDSGDSLTANEIPAGLQFARPGGSCDSLLKWNEYLKIEGGNVNVYEKIVSTGIPNPVPMKEHVFLNFTNNRTYQNTFTVVNANSSGTGSLRQAIDSANIATGASKIIFNIPDSLGVPPYVINLTQDNIFNKEIFIHGSSQPDNGFAGKGPKIVLDGQNSVDNPIGINHHNCWVEGLYFRNSPSSSIFVYFGDSTHIINNIINRSQSGIGMQVSHSVVQGNILGTDLNYSNTMGNDAGVVQSNNGGNNIIGGSYPGEGNTIAFNNRGILIYGNTHYNRLSRNRIFSNNSFGINIQGTSNQGKDHPIITTVNNSGVISGTSAPNDLIEIFRSTGYENANEYFATTVADISGNWSMSGLNISVNDGFVATATDVNGNTSILSYIFDIDVLKVNVAASVRGILICSSPIRMSAGHGNFDIDPNSGALVYFAEDNNCNSQPVECIRFCNGIYSGSTLTNAVDAGAQTFSDMWQYDGSAYGGVSSSNNPYQSGARGKWRVNGSYSYNADITGISAPYVPGSAVKNYNSGKFTLEMFNHKTERANNPQKWLNLSTVTAYSPDGNALEEHNILGIYSAEKFGYDNTRAILKTGNAQNNQVFFESFEKHYSNAAGNFFEDGLQDLANNGAVVSDIAHSGKKSFKLIREDVNGFDLKGITATPQIIQNGLSVKVWVREAPSNPPLVAGTLVLPVHVSGALKSTNNFIKIAQSGEWTLYEARITGLTGVSAGDMLYAGIKYNFYSNLEGVWIDDVRVQPLDAAMTAYVYDVKTLKLVAAFDDQHFGLYYQYNAEGKLVRMIKETERGMKTIKETQYNAPVVAR